MKAHSFGPQMAHGPESQDPWPKLFQTTGPPLVPESPQYSAARGPGKGSVIPDMVDLDRSPTKQLPGCWALFSQRSDCGFRERPRRWRRAKGRVAPLPIRGCWLGEALERAETVGRWGGRFSIVAGVVKTTNGHAGRPP